MAKPWITRILRNHACGKCDLRRNFMRLNAEQNFFSNHTQWDILVYGSYMSHRHGFVCLFYRHVAPMEYTRLIPLFWFDQRCNICSIGSYSKQGKNLQIIGHLNTSTSLDILSFRRLSLLGIHPGQSVFYSSVGVTSGLTLTGPSTHLSCICGNRRCL